MISNIDHLSYSAISLYSTCPRAWRYKYIDKVPSPATPELAFGKAFHDTVEGYVASQFAPKRVNLTEYWLEKWQKQATEGGVEWGLDTPETYANLGLKMFGHEETANVINGIVPAMSPTESGPMIERKIELHVPGVPLPIIGYIDCVGSDSVPMDFKTSARAWTMDKAQEETQSLFYLAALNQAGENAHNWQFRHIVFVKTKQPQVQVFSHKHSPAEVFWLFDLIKSVWKGIESEVWPMNPGSWKCAPRFCEAWSMCRGKYINGG